MDLAKWQTIAVPKGLIERMDEFLESKEARRMGVSTRPQMLSMILRDFLDKWDSEK